jgi:glyoxylase-like metal-dependent hydrolase (beta-lactamase superfamily II)
MILVNSMSPRWLSNTWLVADEPGGHAVVIDAGAPVEPILAAIETHRLTPTHVLLTHHHPDHVVNAGEYARRFGSPVCGHAAERELFAGVGQRLDRELGDGESLASGGLTVRALHIPGHTLGQLGFLVDGKAVFTGDTLFRRSVGGTRGRGHSSFADLERSILEVLMALPPETAVYPGHAAATTVGEEWQENPFIRLWRGLETASEEPCRALGAEATLMLRAADYDGGEKCQVRFADGRLDVVPGSRVEFPGG